MLEMKNYDERTAAVILGISRITLHRARKRGEIGFFRIGSRVLYSQDQLREFLERHERKAVA